MTKQCSTWLRPESTGKLQRCLRPAGHAGACEMDADSLAESLRRTLQPWIGPTGAVEFSVRASPEQAEEK